MGGFFEFNPTLEIDFSQVAQPDSGGEHGACVPKLPGLRVGGNCVMAVA